MEVSVIADAPSTAAYCQLIADKTADGGNGQDMWVDHFEIELSPYAFDVHRTTPAQVYTGSGGWTQIDFQTETYDYGGNYDNSANYRFDVPEDGVYSFSAITGLTTATTGSVVAIALYLNGAIYFRGARIEVPSTATSVSLPLSAPECLLSAGDYVDVRVYNGGGTNAAQLFGPTETRFMGAKRS